MWAGPCSQVRSIQANCGVTIVCFLCNSCVCVCACVCGSGLSQPYLAFLSTMLAVRLIPSNSWQDTHSSRLSASRLSTQHYHVMIVPLWRCWQCVLNILLHSKHTLESSFRILSLHTALPRHDWSLVTVLAVRLIFCTSQQILTWVVFPHSFSPHSTTTS